jgi:hypothetical protein
MFTCHEFSKGVGHWLSYPPKKLKIIFDGFGDEKRRVIRGFIILGQFSEFGWFRLVSGAGFGKGKVAGVVRILRRKLKVQGNIASLLL